MGFLVRIPDGLGDSSTTRLLLPSSACFQPPAACITPTTGFARLDLMLLSLLRVLLQT